MFHYLAILHAEYVDANHWFRSPANVATVNHHEIAFGDDHTWLVGEILGQFRDECLDCVRAIRNGRIVLDVMWIENFIDNTGVSVDKRTRQCLQRKLLVGFYGTLLRFLLVNSLLQQGNAKK